MKNIVFLILFMFPCLSFANQNQDSDYDFIINYELSTVLILNRAGINVTKKFFDEQLEIAASAGVYVNLVDTLKVDADAGVRAKFYFTNKDAVILGALHVMGAQMKVDKQKAINALEFGYGWREGKQSTSSKSVTLRRFSLREDADEDLRDNFFILMFNYENKFQF